jgi:hypothetical protein
MCALAVGAAPAAALAPPVAPPAPVAGPLPDGTSLYAANRGGDLCLGPRQPPTGCGAPPRTAARPRYGFDGRHVFGAVTADVASVEIRSAARRQLVPTSVGAYRGPLRFYLAPLAPGERPYRLRMLDATGRALGAFDIGDPPALSPPVAVARGHVGLVAWRAVAYQHSVTRPTPLDLARPERTTCVSVGFGGAPARGGSCATRDPDPGSVTFSSSERCDARSVSGLVGPSVSRVDALLGDGSRRRVALAALPARFDELRRAFAFAVPKGVAVRSLLVARSGRTAPVPLGLVPAGSRCPGAIGFDKAVFGFASPLTTPAAGTGPVVAGDRGDDLCVGFGAIVFADCRLPPVDVADTRLERRRAGARTAILAVVPTTVAALRLSLDQGPALTVPVSDLPGYDGRYKGLVKGVAVTLPGDRRVYGADLLAASGAVLHRVTGPDQHPLPSTPRVLARLPTGLAVAALASGRCVQVRAGSPTRDRADCLPAFEDVAITVPCGARRIVVVARLPKRARGLAVTTDAGTTISGRRHGALAVAIVPARLGVRDVRAIGVARTATTLPPAAEQCGYTTSLRL